jgi:diadenosine tetraphosphatase ApaH/serine/threonine PP2A family protein phosphatase
MQDQPGREPAKRGSLTQAELRMRIALLSDIHGNREALDACLAHAARQRVDRYVFLGDLVGYGADPAYVVDVVREAMAKGALALLGNHDEAAVHGQTEGMNDYARAALEWTHRALDADAREFISQLPMKIEEDDRLYVHSEASAPKAWAYITDVATAERSLRSTNHRLTFCGHVHKPQLYHMSPMKPPVFFLPQSAMPIPLVGNRKWLAVQGAVGQPRDHNPAAAYSVLDTDKNELTYQRVPYDIERAAGKIHAARLPQILAARLFIGR